ncbi:transposable element Tcb2 transposase [Trichonephila clavipes]|nr:transposable element Tcb2 transposase [Trichonephila clavipes]
MLLHRHWRHYEQLSEFECRRIIEMMETGGSTWSYPATNLDSILGSEGSYIRLWRPRSERFNPAFTVQRHNVPITGVMVWDAIANDTRSAVILIHGIMTVQRYLHDILQPHVLLLMAGLQ